MDYLFKTCSTLRAGMHILLNYIQSEKNPYVVAGFKPV